MTYEVHGIVLTIMFAFALLGFGSAMLWLLTELGWAFWKRLPNLPEAELPQFKIPTGGTGASPQRCPYCDSATCLFVRLAKEKNDHA